MFGTIPEIKWARQKFSYISHPEEARTWCAKLSIKNDQQKLKFWNFKQTWHATYLLKLFDKMCKYEMDPASIVEDTEQTRFAYRRTDGQTPPGAWKRFHITGPFVDSHQRKGKKFGAVYLYLAWPSCWKHNRVAGEFRRHGAVITGTVSH